jgi:hypothetical protein
MEVLRGCERVIRLNEPNSTVGMPRGRGGPTRLGYLAKHDVKEIICICYNHGAPYTIFVVVAYVFVISCDRASKMLLRARIRRVLRLATATMREGLPGKSRSNFSPFNSILIVVALA